QRQVARDVADDGIALGECDRKGVGTWHGRPRQDTAIMPTVRTLQHLRRAVMGVLAAALFLFAWLYRFNDPSGSFAGLTDDHFFYLIRGWQLLFGDLPVRDFVDHGAPLYYYVGAAVQLFGRGTLSELVFS